MTRKVISTIDLNTVDEDVLVKKLKISRRLADRIIALRPYHSVEQLKSVWGIDPAVLQRILPLVSISQPEIADTESGRNSSFAKDRPSACGAANQKK